MHAGEYSAERLRELRANTAQLPASKVDKAAVKAASDSVFKLSGSFKKPGAPQDDRFEPLIQPVRTFFLPIRGVVVNSLRAVR